MSDTIFLEKCQTYIESHLHASKGKARRTAQLPAVTLSRQSGTGGAALAHRLATWLQEHQPGTPCPWTVFDKNLVQRALQEHHLPERLAEFMPEDKVSGIADAMEELLGLHPSSWNLVRQATETTLQLAELGNVILVGRGANVITRRLTHVFHVRLVGSLDRRVARVMENRRISRAAALDFVRKEDAGRKSYLKKYFGEDVENPLLYHLVVNTDLISLEAAAEMVGQQILQRWS